MVPSGSAWFVEPSFGESLDARENLSGIACAPTMPAFLVCLAVNDEARYVQFFSIADRRIVPHAVMLLLPGEEGGTHFEEIDAEAAAYDGGYFYVAGSHGLGRHSAAVEPSRFFVFRFPVGQGEGAGRSAFPISREQVFPAIERSSKLRDALKQVAPAGAFAEKPLEANGVNIEGLAVRDGTMFLGLRAPSLDGNAFVMTARVDEVFGPGEVKPEVFRLPLGQGIGVRDLARVRDGFLVLSGPAGDEPGPAAVFLWTGTGGEVKELAELRSGPKAKAEALLVLDDSPDRDYRLLILHDGIADGAPTEYQVPR